MRERRERERERVRGRRRTREGSEGEGRGEGWKAKRRGGKREIERERSRQERVKIPWPSPARTLGIPCCGGDRGALSPLSWLSSPTEQPSPRLEGIVFTPSTPVDHHSVATGVEGVNTNPPTPLTIARSLPHTHYGLRIRTKACVQVWTYVLMRAWRE